jgi:hypothetical protein
MKPAPGFGIKWLKALMCSPGVLFAFAYLALWNATNIYLDHAFRGKLERAFSSVTGSHYRLTIGSLATGPDFSTLTLERLELVSMSSGSPGKPPRIRFDKLDIACPEIGLLMVRPSMVEAATMQVSKALLNRCSGGITSMDHQAGPPPADGSYLASRVSQQREVRIP